MYILTLLGLCDHFIHKYLHLDEQITSMLMAVGWQTTYFDKVKFDVVLSSVKVEKYKPKVNPMSFKLIQQILKLNPNDKYKYSIFAKDKLYLQNFR